MAGENILVVDDSVAVQELCRSVLENHGYRVSVASNGMAALSYPDMEAVDLLIIDTDLRGVSGFETTRSLKTDEELHKKPILLLVPEEQTNERESQNLYGGNAYLKKPFEPSMLVNKVQVLLEEHEILEQGREYLRKAADSLMTRLAEHTIQEAVNNKIQIISERVLQNVVSQVDQKARREVDSRVTQLTAEKEQELVKKTVHEVARSMVEKLAERKVTEAMEMVLETETEKHVRRMAESLLPGLVRERVRENLENHLPREIQRRVQKETEQMVPQATEKILQAIDSAAQKIVPKTAKEVMGDIAQGYLDNALAERLPRQVQHEMHQELEAQLRSRISPLIRDAASRVGQRVRLLSIVLLVLVIAALGVSVYNFLLMRRTSEYMQQLEQRVAASTPGAQAPVPTPAPLLDIFRKMGRNQ